MPFVLIIFLLLGCVTIDAHDFGVCGTTFSIEEQNILEYLRERLLHADPEELELFSKRQVQALQWPKPLDLPCATRYRAVYYDPSITVKEEIVDDEGNIIVRQGANYNPLGSGSLGQNLLFFDGLQKSHIKWAKKMGGKWILVSGNPIALEAKEGRPVYFDQFGYMTGKFGIQAIPAMVSQEGKVLLIEEFPLGSQR